MFTGGFWFCNLKAIHASSEHLKLFLCISWIVLLVGISTLLKVWTLILIKHPAWVTLLGFHVCFCLNSCLNCGGFLFFPFACRDLAAHH